MRDINLDAAEFPGGHTGRVEPNGTATANSAPRVGSAPGGAATENELRQVVAQIATVQQQPQQAGTAAAITTTPVTAPPPSTVATQQQQQAAPTAGESTTLREQAQHCGNQQAEQGRAAVEQISGRFTMGSGTLSRDQLTTGFGVGLNGPVPGHFSGATGPYMGGGELRQGEAGHIGRVEQSYQAVADSNVARGAQARGDTATTTEILRGNPNVGVSVDGGAPVYGEQAAQAVEHQAREQTTSAGQQTTVAGGMAASASELMAGRSGIDLSRTIRDMVAERSAALFGGETNAAGEFAGGQLAVPVGLSDTPWDVAQRSLRMFASSAGLPADEQASFVADWSQRLRANGETGLYHYAADGTRRVYTAAEFAGMQQQGMFSSRLSEGWQPEIIADLRQRAARSDEVVSVATAGAPQAGSQEGIRSFVVGGLAGGFSSNDTWSAVAGQTAIGLVPVAGQVADVRDIAAAAGDVYEGEEGGWAGLGIAMVAIIPGLDFLKGGSRAGRKLLAEAAERSFSQVTEQGLQRLGTVLGREAVEQAEGELRVLAVAREEMLTRLDALQTSGNLSQNAQGSVRAARNSLQNSFSQEDLIGALQDAHSMPVIINGRTYDHFREVRNTIDSLANARRSMLDDLDRVAPSTDRYWQLSQESEAILETIRRTEGFLNIR